MSSTRKTPEHSGPAYSSPSAAAEVAAEAAEAAAEVVEAAAAEAAVYLGELAGSARLDTFHILTDAGRDGRV
jgi:hypothetical protein